MEPVDKPPPSHELPRRQLYKTYSGDKLRQAHERTGTSYLHRNPLKLALALDLRQIEDQLFAGSHHPQNIESPIHIDHFAGNSSPQGTD